MSTDNKQPNGSDTRPEGTARSVGLKKRQRFTTRLHKEATVILTEKEYRTAHAAATSISELWTIVRLRPEVVAVATAMQQRHVETTNKEIAKSEVISALVLAGLKSLSEHEDFARGLGIGRTDPTGNMGRRPR